MVYTNQPCPVISNGIAAHTLSHRSIDLRSDTVSQPTPEMREAIANAIVGDSVYGEDPTVSELELRSAKMFGKEAALFVPSGTMGNLLAIMTHCNARGSEVIVGDLSHVFLYEQGNPAQIAGVQLSTVPNNPDGTFCLKAFAQKIRCNDIHEPITQLAIIENTHNICGGKVIPLAFLDAWTELCRNRGVSTHMDGARVFNAATFLDVPVSRLARDLDSVSFCLSKGLSAPAGSVLVGSSRFIKQAERFRKALGGGMRQVGFLAAAGLCSLEQIVPVLKHDHRRTLKIAQAIDALKSPWIRVDLRNVQTNILIVEIISENTTGNRSPSDFAARLGQVLPKEITAGVCDAKGRGIVVRLFSRDWKFVRFVVYHQITDEAVDLIIKKIEFCVREWDASC